MRQLFALTATALLALTLVADEKKADAKPASTAETAATETRPQPRVIQAAVSIEADSPLVAASKRANRLGKTPTNVITNDTLKTVGGHFTTTDKQYAVPAPPPPTEAEIAAKRNAEIYAQKKRATEEAARKQQEKLAQERQRRAAEAIDYAGDAYESDDPARDEHRAEEVKKSQEQKPPHR